MTRREFSYADNFPDLTDEQIDTACETVSTVFYGVLHCWQKFAEPLRTQKREALLNLLVGWYLLDLKPESAVGVLGNGGMALSSKSIGGTSVGFAGISVQNGLEQLNTNVFGQKALLMIQGIPERFNIYA